MGDPRPKKEILMRLKRIEGQIRGIQRMVEAGAACPDILTQVAAATAALKKVGSTIVRTYMEECLEESRKEPVPKHREALKEFETAISRYLDYA
ncbi:MAG: metal-sensitive transcriptional regulator [Desulfobacterota bacterium]|nr:metal-sensitive transcriptional regulator [Thermodesulfobacteriota bacterium]